MSTSLDLYWDWLDETVRDRRLIGKYILTSIVGGRI